VKTDVRISVGLQHIEQDKAAAQVTKAMGKI
jgi:hypothetical protein